MRIFITGLAGFIGSHLAERLLSQGHTVTGCDDFSSGKYIPKEGIILYDCNCLAKSKLNYIIKETKPDYIYHLAATVGVNRVLENPKKCIENNIESLRNVLDFGIPGMFASTSEVYGKNQTIVSENSDLILSSKKRWSYAMSKMIGEYLVHEHDGWKSVRFFNVVGPRQSTHYGAVLPTFVGQAIDGKPITVHGTGTQVRTFIDVRDCVSIIDQLRDKAFSVVNVGGDYAFSMNDLAVKVNESLHTKSEIELVPYKDVYKSGFEDCKFRVPDLTKLKSLIPSLEYRSFRDTVRDLADYLKDSSATQKLQQGAVINAAIDELSSRIAPPVVVRRRGVAVPQFTKE